MSVQKQIDRLITQRASEWFESLRGGQEADPAEFVRWIGESPRHMAELMAIIALNEELPGAFARSGIDRDALLKRISAPVSALPVPGRAASRHPARKIFSRRRLALAAAVLVAVGAGLWLTAQRLAQGIATAPGEQRTVALADGSLMYLNAHSSVQVKFDSAARDVRLIEGEAMFQVAHERNRPFRVRTRDAVIQAVGTQFNVDARASGTVVSVLEGKVEVSSEGAAAGANAAPVAAGEAAEVSRGGKVKRRASADVAGAVAWRQRQLVFSKTSLEDVAADFNRFHKSGRMLLEDVAPGSHHYTGTFDADDVASFAQLLSREADLEVEQRGGDYVIRRAAEKR